MSSNFSPLHLLERAISASSNAIIIADATRSDTPIIYCNPAFETLTGYSHEEILGQNCCFLQGPDTDPVTLQTLHLALQQKQNLKVTLKNYRKDQTPFWNELTLSPVPDLKGQITHFISIQTDVTPRVLAEVRLQEQETQMSSLIASIPGVIYRRLWDTHWTIQSISPAIITITGYPATDFENNQVRSFASLIHPEDREFMTSIVVNQLAHRQTYSLEYRIIDQEGCIRWLSEKGRGRFDAQGNLQWLDGVIFDITDRKHTEAVLQTSEVRFQKLVATIPGLIYQFRLDVNGSMSFPYMSSSCQELLELDPESLQASASSVLERIHPDHYQSFCQSLHHSALTLQPWQWEGQWILPSGQIKWIQSVSRPEKCPNGNILWDGLFIDISDHKQVEEECRRSAAKNRSLINAIPDAIFRLNSAGVFLEFIPATDFPLCVSTDAVLGKSIADIFPPEIATPLQNVIVQALSTNVTHIFEYSMMFENQRRYFEARMVHCEGEELLATVREITEHKQVQSTLEQTNQQLENRVKERTAALQQSQQMLQLVINNIPQLIFWKDQNSVYLGCNQNFARAAGVEVPENIVGKTDYELPWTSEEATWFRACDRQVMENNTPEYHIIEPQLQADGRQTWADTNKIPLHNEQGQVVGILGTYEDITERIAMEAALRQSEELFRTMFEDAPIGISLIALDSEQIVRVNKVFCELFGYSTEQLLQTKLAEITLSEDLTKNLEDVKSLANGTINRYQTETRFTAASGEIVWANITATLIRDSSGNPRYNLVMIENITDRKIAEAILRASESQLRKQAAELQDAYKQLQQAQAQLVQTEKMSSLGQLVAGIAHEINNPVSFISGNIAYTKNYFNNLIEVIELYQSFCPNPSLQICQKLEEIELDFLLEDVPKILASIEGGAERIRKIVMSLRNFSRLDEADLKEVDIHEGIENTLLILQHRLLQSGQSANIEVMKEYGKLPKVECFPGPLNQVFLNILSNAIDALQNQPEPRLITIRTELKTPDQFLRHETQNGSSIKPPYSFSPATVLICIADSGPGMTPEVLPRLFDPFFTTKPIGAGTGLGLSISYQIVVEKHGGNLYCLSRPGQGAEFYIEIPLTIKRPFLLREPQSIVL